MVPVRSSFKMTMNMAVLKRKRRTPNSFTASFDREEEWKRCCAKVMGFEWVDHFDDGNDDFPTSKQQPEGGIQQIINLLEDSTEEKYSEDETLHDGDSSVGTDPWAANALRIQADLHRMTSWIQHKKHEFVGLNMQDEDASIIQSTVTAFAATTASELETLRKLIPPEDSGHKQGIVQILLHQLQEEITKPFGILQKQRSRVSVKLWQHPWQCQLPQGRANTVPNRAIHLFDSDNVEPNESSLDKRFVPRDPLPSAPYGFIENYQWHSTQECPPKPEFLDRLASVKREVSGDESSLKSEVLADGFVPPVPTLKIQSILPMPNQEQHQAEELEQEAVLMQETIVRSDLDSVQKMEQRMVEITTLISQFSNLVSEQQEDILEIAHHTRETKQNMNKGQENLVDAAERTKRSKHYLAWIIFGLSLTLLFFHTLRN